MAIFAKTVFRVLAIRWARRGVKAIVGCLNNSGFIIKTMVNIRIDFGRFFVRFFPIQTNPPKSKNQNPWNYGIFFGRKGRKKYLQNGQPDR